MTDYLHALACEEPAATAEGWRRLLGSRRRTEAPAVPEVTEVAMSKWKSTLIALTGLVVILGLALGEMALGGAVLHALNPARNFDVFYALHHQLVLGTLLGLSVLWLLPPHPWAKKLIVPADQEPATEVAGEAESDGVSNVIALSDYLGRGPPHRPRAKREAHDP